MPWYTGMWEFYKVGATRLQVDDCGLSFVFYMHVL